MIRHVVMFSWVDGTTEDIITSVARQLDAMAADIDSLVGFHHGPDIGANDGNFDYVVTADFDDLAGYLAYRDHPRHRGVVSTVLAPLISARSAVQFEVSG